jgi:hypothetical protein
MPIVMHRPAVLEELHLDGTGVRDEVLPPLAPLACTLEYVTVVRPPELGAASYVTEAGVQAAMAAFAERGGAPEISFQ